mmetsp:Transcript_23179/g.58829  ORF Transcript_23179/g.58829 Transcript_23179/m.58829 type:complete len:152 (-) Transcript_23179:45-500(-)
MPLRRLTVIVLWPKVGCARVLGVEALVPLLVRAVTAGDASALVGYADAEAMLRDCSAELARVPNAVILTALLPVATHPSLSKGAPKGAAATFIRQCVRLSTDCSAAHLRAPLHAAVVEVGCAAVREPLVSALRASASASASAAVCGGITNG